MILAKQQHLRAELERWLYKYQTLRQSLQGVMSYQENKGCRLLSAYHNMANIMIDVCLCLGNELAFDAHTAQFVFLVGQLAELWLYAEANSPPRLGPERRPGHFVDMAQSYVTWVGIRYFTTSLPNVASTESDFKPSGYLRLAPIGKGSGTQK